MTQQQDQCNHPRVKPVVLDQTLGVQCMSCNEVLGWCWYDKHVSEALWNRACTEDDLGVPCEQSRDNYCAVCEEKFCCG